MTDGLEDLWWDGNDLACRFGRIVNPDGRYGSPQPLMVTTSDYVDMLLTDGPQVDRYNQTNSAARRCAGLFFTSVIEGRSFVWRLYPAQLDGKLLLLGRWPD